MFSDKNADSRVISPVLSRRDSYKPNRKLDRL